MPYHRSLPCLEPEQNSPTIHSLPGSMLLTELTLGNSFLKLFPAHMYQELPRKQLPVSQVEIPSGSPCRPLPISSLVEGVQGSGFLYRGFIVYGSYVNTSVSFEPPWQYYCSSQCSNSPSVLQAEWRGGRE